MKSVTSRSRDYYIIIPPWLRYANLKPSGVKLLYAEILLLSKKHGYCSTKNAAFAKPYQKDKRTITRWVAILKEQQYIRTETIYEGDSKKVTERKIFPLVFSLIK